MPPLVPNHVVVLCEDAAHKLFTERWLKSRGVPSRRIRTLPSPAGKGAGEKFVRVNYPIEVAYYRQKSFTSRQLVVVIDGDTQAVQHRFEQLSQGLNDAGLEDRKLGERICILVPKRNIETWVRALIGDDVDEASDYGKQDEGVIRQAADAYQPWLEGQGETVPSMASSRGEVKRLDGE